MKTFRTRRATVDDLPALRTLCRSVQLSAENLEKHLTDFQLAEDEATNELCGAIAIAIESGDGRLYAEAFTDFSLTDTLRPILWQRIKTVAQNYGLFRLWTQEGAPWWKKDAGFTPATTADLGKLPEHFGPRTAPWLTLRLRDEIATPDFLEKEIALFQETERAKRGSLVRQGKILRVIAILLSLLFFGAGAVILFYMVKNRR